MATPESSTPTPSRRAAVVRQDLDNVLHPAVEHRQLEAEPMVIVEGRGSTVVDADGTEYLDAMAGGLSRPLLNLAERDGTASYPQFTALRGIPT